MITYTKKEFKDLLNKVEALLEENEKKDRQLMEFTDKACEWLKNNLGYYDRHEVHIGKSYEEVVIDDFRKAMEE